MSIPRPDKLPEWASVPQNDPNKPVPNIVEPPSGKKQLGWIFEEFPPSNWFNWLLNKIYKWLQYFDNQHVNVAPIFGIDTSTTVNQVEVTLTPSINNYVEGRLFLVKIANTNTGASTLEINGKGAWPILDLDGNSLVGGEIVQDIIYMFVFSEGTAPGEEHFILQSKPDASSSMTAGDWKWTIKTTPDPGYILYNAFDSANPENSTIGDGSSGAPILADAKAEKLFKAIWNNTSEPECKVYDSTGTYVGKGASADADWTAHRRINVPDIPNRVFGARSTQAMAGYEGEREHSLSWDEMAFHSHGYQDVGFMAPGYKNDGAAAFNSYEDGTTDHAGASSAHNNMQPTVYFNVMMKL